MSAGSGVGLGVGAVAAVVAPVLVFGWGNLSRGDDALGPLLIERLRALAPNQPWADAVELLDDYQLQVEHALDLAGRQRVLFVDASLDGAAPFAVSLLSAAQDASYTTHAMSPQAVMHVYGQLHQAASPPCTLLAIRGMRFELGESPGAAALAHLEAALQWAVDWLGPAAGRSASSADRAPG